MSGIVSVTGGANRAGRYPAPSRSAENFVSELRAFYVADGTEGFTLDPGQFQGDRITWSGADYLAIRLVRSTGGEQIPFMAQMGASGWGFDASSPGVIKLNEGGVAAQAGETFYLIGVNRYQSLLRPEFPNFWTDTFDVPSSQTTFTLSRPVPSSYVNGRFRGRAYVPTVGGVRVTLNPDNGTTGGNYQEVVTNGLVTALTFNDPVIGPQTVEVEHKGFYDADNISVQQLAQHGSRITTLESNVYDLHCHTHGGFGATNTRIPYFTTVVKDTGAGKWTSDVSNATLGCSFTFLVPGLVTISYFGNANPSAIWGVTLNSSELSTNLQNIVNINDRKAATGTDAAGEQASATASFRVAVNDIVRPHQDATAPFTASLCGITMSFIEELS